MSNEICDDVFATDYADVHSSGMDYRPIISTMMSVTGKTQTQMAKYLGVSQPTVARWLKKGAKPDVPQHDRIVAYAKKLGVLNADLELVPPQKKEKFAGSSAQKRPFNHRDLSLTDTLGDVPEIDLRAGASYAGGFNQEENTIDQYGNSVSSDAVRARWGIPLPFLRDELHIQTGRAHILSVRGDSMNDALFDGDRAIINLDDTDVSQGGIFALLDDNSSVIIKQVELLRVPGSNARRVKCTSRNPVYAPFELELDGERVRIIGRVASKITRL